MASHWSTCGLGFFRRNYFLGVPVGGLRLFHVMELTISSGLTIVPLLLIQIIELVACAIFVRVYAARIRNRNIKPFKLPNVVVSK